MGPRTREFLRISNPVRQSVLGDRIGLADTTLTRFVGLMGRRSLAPGHGLLIRPSNGVHTFWMRFSIDVLLLDREYRVLAAYGNLRAFRLTAINWKASSALELPSGTIAATNTQLGDQLQLVPVTP
ncbi:MAG TPA: DUF192 domain-containing protein [Edaphobacter sp.]|jgi:hypothetical protein|nr:DUF192 domain-containing protein [Edaphobacter sp.]